jgi:hypothetical protein
MLIAQLSKRIGKNKATTENRSSCHVLISPPRQQGEDFFPCWRGGLIKKMATSPAHSVVFFSLHYEANGKLPFSHSQNDPKASWKVKTVF